MPIKDLHIGTPFAAIRALQKEEGDTYIEQLTDLPPSINELVISANTGSYINGLAKTHDLPNTKTAAIAYCVLQIAFGKKDLSQLPSLLSAEVQLPNDQSQKMANEIEKDLFTPIMLDLNNYLAKKKQNAKPQSPTDGLGNVVNLKDKPKPNKPFPLPPRT